MEEKARNRDVKNQRLQDLYLRQRCKLNSNLMHSKARQLNIHPSYLSPISSETFVRNTPVDFTQINEEFVAEMYHSFKSAQLIEEAPEPIQSPVKLSVITGWTIVHS